jgi:hypothetical protein
MKRKLPRAAKPPPLTVTLISCALISILLCAVLKVSVAPTRACEDTDPRLIYNTMKAETGSHQTYTATFSVISERGSRHQTYARYRVSGKYVREPARYCEKRLSMEASFPEQAGEGYQECYTEKDDMSRILMPGALRVLGVIPMYPEDPKADYINGENLKRAAVWEWFDGWDRMLEAGEIKAGCEDRGGKERLLITIKGRPDPVYGHDRVKIWIDRETWFPVRVETYARGDEKPALVFEFEEVKLSVPLTDDDMEFEGLAPGWNLSSISIPEGPKLDGLETEEPKLSEADFNTQQFMGMLDKALSGVRDYETKMTVELRYCRLRQYREERFLFVRQGNAFSSLNTRLEANYILLNAGEGFRAVYDPGRDGLLHVLPSGVYRLMGEQTFPLDDPRIFTAIGDNVTELNFFAIRDRLKKTLENAVETKAATAAYKKARGPWIEFAQKKKGVPKVPTVTRLLLDDMTRLPRRLEYRGYDDPRAYLAVTFDNTRVNQGIKKDDLRD